MVHITFLYWNKMWQERFFFAMCYQQVAVSFEVCKTYEKSINRMNLDKTEIRKYVTKRSSTIRFFPPTHRNYRKMQQHPNFRSSRTSCDALRFYSDVFLNENKLSMLFCQKRNKRFIEQRLLLFKRLYTVQLFLNASYTVRVIACHGICTFRALTVI